MSNETSGPKRDGESSDLQELRVRRESPAAGSRDAFLTLKRRLCDDISAQFGPELPAADRAEARTLIQEKFDMLLADMGVVLNRTEKRRLFEDVVAELYTS